MEADLQRVYQVDYRDRWAGRLTLRRLSALIRHLPPDAAVWRAVDPDGAADSLWGMEHYLLDDLRMWVEARATGTKPDPHPARPKRKAVLLTPTVDRARKLRDARRRSRDRRRAIDEIG